MKIVETKFTNINHVKVTKVHFMDREYVREVSNAGLLTCMFVILCIFTNVRRLKVVKD